MLAAPGPAHQAALWGSSMTLGLVFLPKSEILMVGSELRLAWHARLLGRLQAGCSQPAGPNPGPMPPFQPLTEHLPTGMAHTSPHVSAVSATVSAGDWTVSATDATSTLCPHLCHPQTLASPPNTSITLKHWHHSQISASAPNTSITPKHRHHPQIPASLSNCSIIPEAPYKLQMHSRCCVMAPQRRRLPRSIF